ncbi:MAG: hypothetical protein COA53_06580 [Rhodobacteraceae bacterium]|nr:MAG: hypothetical protein COA53_06580 [Paracoccaceae bacterium]
MNIELLTPIQAADLLKVSTKTLARMRQTGLRCVRLGRCVRYRADDLQEFIAANIEDKPCRSRNKVARSGSMTGRSKSTDNIIGFGAALANEAKRKPVQSRNRR